MGKIDVKIEDWKNKLLDTGKRNRLINYKETKRSNINIVSPSAENLFDQLVIKEKHLSFSYPQDFLFDDLENEDENEGEVEKKKINVIPGNIETNKTIGEQQKTLKVLRGRAKTAMEEMGINTLYLSFGFLNWSEKKESLYLLSSPLVLVPVYLINKSLTSPYELAVHEDEIVVNPTLKHKLANDFGFQLPEFDHLKESLLEYLESIKKMVETGGGGVESRFQSQFISPVFFKN